MIPKKLKDIAKKANVEIISLYGNVRVKIRNLDNFEQYKYMTVQQLKGIANKNKTVWEKVLRPEDVHYVEIDSDSVEKEKYIEEDGFFNFDKALEDITEKPKKRLGRPKGSKNKKAKKTKKAKKNG